eukprot:scaffold10109_cov51-Attheya_sp.AAC.3
MAQYKCVEMYTRPISGAAMIDSFPSFRLTDHVDSEAAVVIAFHYHANASPHFCCASLHHNNISNVPTADCCGGRPMCLAPAAIHIGLVYAVGNKTLILLWRQAHIRINRDIVRGCCCLDRRRKYARYDCKKRAKYLGHVEPSSCRATQPHESHQYKYGK